MLCSSAAPLPTTPVAISSVARAQRERLKTLGGGVPVQLPVPKAPLLAKRGANPRFALSTLFAILQLQLLHPPLKLGDRPRLLEQFAQGVPFVLGEVDTYIVLPKPERERWPLLLRQRREVMPAVPRILGRPSFEHGPELGQVGVPSNEIVHSACWAKVNIHAQLRATCRRKRELQVIDLERLRQDNS